MPSEITIRPCTWSDWPAFQEVMSSGFGGELTADGRQQWEPVLEFDAGRMLAAFDSSEPAEQMVGTAGWMGWTMTVPGAELPTAAVTMVTVRPSHRRRGILRQLMLRQFEDTRSQGYPLATLWASESIIYQRFGYGAAFLRGRIDVDPRRAAFMYDRMPAGRPRMLTIEEALELLPPVYERARQSIPGTVKRSELWWKTRTLCDLPGARRGGGPHFRVALYLDGAVEGYAIYNVHSGWTPDGLPNATLDVVEAIGVTPAATREVWRYLFGVDLIGRVRSHRLNLDHPLALSLTDPRQLRLASGDGTWVRLVEIEQALPGRRYLAEDTITFELTDAACPWNAGVWTLEAGPTGASLRRTAASPDLRLSTAELSAMYLGTVRASSLLRASRLDELTPGAAYRADTLFAWHTPPWCLDDF